jgi:peptidoglycan hydrolase CwlO-like protein
MTARENAETADLVRDRDEWQRVAAQRGEELERSEREVERLRGELEASQGMRETLCATLKLANDNTEREMAKAQSLTEQLAEATGLLERYRRPRHKQDADIDDDTDAFLSRAPAQAAEPTPCENCDRLDQQWHEADERAESAESKLAAVQSVVTRTEEVIAERSESPAMTQHRQSVGYARIRDLLAPSQGEGGGGNG